MDQTSNISRSPTGALRSLSVAVAMVALGLWSGASMPALALEAPLNLIEVETHSAVDGVAVRTRATRHAGRLRIGRRFTGSVSVVLCARAASCRAWVAPDHLAWVPGDGWGNPAATRGPPYAID